jgi:hypothetical protein
MVLESVALFAEALSDNAATIAMTWAAACALAWAFLFQCGRCSDRRVRVRAFPRRAREEGHGEGRR